MGDNEEALRNERVSHWQIEQVRQRNKEKKYIIALIIIIAIGFFLDFIEFIMQNPSIALPKNIAALLNTSRFIVNNLSNVTLSILQIQAAICPLVIAIIALLSGVISDVYYGVSVCNYYLNIKPIYFKQKRIIIGLISAIGAGVFFYLLGLYNVVFSLFWATCLAIIISIMELYSVFKGQNYIEGELESYCAHMLLNYDVSYDEQKEALSMFTKWWINQHDYGTFYESNKRLFLSSITVILDKKPVEGLELIEELATQIVRNVT
ncbi:MAG: hypothetical protein IKZ85_07200, partial [Pseudobutyrivibrio sp.]|nr:hypothetical protein [Pseudobutyrivibrio sp.]